MQANIDKNILRIEIKLSDREYETEAKLFNYRAWELSRHGLNLFMLIHFASKNADEKFKSPSDIQDFMFAVETACEIGSALILQSWEESDVVLKIAQASELKETEGDKTNA